MDKIDQQIVSNQIKKDQSRKLQKSRSPGKSPGVSGQPSPVNTSMTKIKLAQESPTSSDGLQIHREINLEIMANDDGEDTKKSFLVPYGRLSKVQD